MGFAVFKTRPTSEEVTAALDRIIEREQGKPKHLIVDQGREFKCAHFEEQWCEDRDILPRFGAVNKHGSIAVVERFHRTFKGILQLTTIPEDRNLGAEMRTHQRGLGCLAVWPESVLILIYQLGKLKYQESRLWRYPSAHGRSRSFAAPQRKCEPSLATGARRSFSNGSRR